MSIGKNPRLIRQMTAQKLMPLLLFLVSGRFVLAKGDCRPLGVLTVGCFLSMPPT